MKDRKNSWYFRDYERVPGENGKGYDLVYTGEWYGYGLEKKAFSGMKLRFAVWALLYTLDYLAGALFVSDGALWRWVALPQILTLLGCVYLLMAAGRICLMKAENPYRDFHAGPLRLKKAGISCLALSVVTLLAELIFLCASPCNIARELLYVWELAINIAAAGRILYLVKKYPCIIVRAPEAR